MSALFDDAERFDSHIVVGDTVRRVKDTTEEHVGPGAYRYAHVVSDNRFDLCCCR